MSSAPRALRDWRRAAHPILRAAAAVAAGVAALFAWIIAGFLTGVIAMCTTASGEWMAMWLLLLVVVPIWTMWAVWRLLEPDDADKGFDNRHMRRFGRLWETGRNASPPPPGTDESLT